MLFPKGTTLGIKAVTQRLISSWLQWELASLDYSVAANPFPKFNSEGNNVSELENQNPYIRVGADKALLNK